MFDAACGTTSQILFYYGTFNTRPNLRSLRHHCQAFANQETTMPSVGRVYAALATTLVAVLVVFVVEMPVTVELAAVVKRTVEMVDVELDLGGGGGA